MRERTDGTFRFVIVARFVLFFARFVLGALHVSFCGLYIFCIIRCWEYGLLVFCDGFYVSYFGVVEYDDI